MKLEFSQQILQNSSKYPTSWKSRPVGAELFHADTHTHTHTHHTHNHTAHTHNHTPRTHIPHTHTHTTTHTRARRSLYSHFFAILRTRLKTRYFAKSVYLCVSMVLTINSHFFSIYSNHWLIFVVEAGCIICEVRSASLYKSTLTSIFEMLNGTILWEKAQKARSERATQCCVTCTVHFLFCSPLNFYLFFYRLLPASTLSSSGNVPSRETDGGVLIYWADTVCTATQHEDTDRLVVAFRHCFANAPNN